MSGRLNFVDDIDPPLKITFFRPTDTHQINAVAKWRCRKTHCNQV